MQHEASRELSAEQRQAFDAFYREQYPFAAGYLRRMIHNSDDAYDILIHSFELALARFDEYLTAKEPRYWFFGIVRNSASYFLRRHASLAQKKLPLPRPAATPEELLLEKEAASRSEQILAALPVKYREVAWLRFHDFSYKEIAAQLGLSVAATESRMRRAIILLEPLFAEFMEESK